MTALIKAPLTLALFSLISLSLPSLGWAHGGTPRVLSVSRSGDHLDVLDTLGLFELTLPAPASRPPSPPLNVSAWRWLCDDAVDESAGVDVALRLSPTLIIAVARSGPYRSVDGGCSFEPIGAPLSEHSVKHLSAHPDRPQEVLAATQTLGRPNDVFLSEDGGVQWQAAGLRIEGGVYALWRDPKSPDEVWVSHAQGLSRSADGGRTFEAVSLELSREPLSEGVTLSAEQLDELTARPTELKLLGGGYVTEGPLRGQRALWMSVNRYPTSTLLQKLNEGAWTPVHQVDDSYESLTFTGRTLITSTLFEGLYRRLMTEEGASWSRDPERALGCLSHAGEEVWGCGRGAMTPWLVGRSTDEGRTWAPLWRSYSDAAGARWGCEPSSPSALACERRCLAEGCDPSGLTSSEEGGGAEALDNNAGDVVDGEGEREAEAQLRSRDEGCAQSLNSPPFFSPSVLVLCFVFLAFTRAFHFFRSLIKQPR